VFGLQIATGDRLTAFLWLRSHELMGGQFWRLGTHMFVHGGFGHIFMNMWGLYIFGKPLEGRIGGTRFLHMYLLSGLIGGATWLMFNWGSPSPVVGASGGVFGVLVAAAIMFPNRVYMMLFPPIPMRLKTLAVVFGAVEVIRAVTAGGGNIAHLAHLGGMVGGYAYMRWLYRASWRRTGTRLSGKTSWFQNIWDNLRPRAPRGGQEPPGPEPDNATMAEVDRILDKIGERGISSLTAAERKTLEQARQRLKGKQ